MSTGNYVKGVLLTAIVFGLVNASGATVSYSYDLLNRLVRVAYADGTTTSYTYDASGNRLSQTTTAPAAALPQISIDKAALSFSTASGQTPPTQAVTVTNVGAGTLSWSAVASADWLTITPASGIGAGSISVSATAAHLPAGTYTAAVFIVASASNTPLAIPIALAVSGASGNPTISSNGITSAAGFTPHIARGSVATVFGTSLADSPVAASTVPLPLTLNNVGVTVNGIAAPLWYVDSNQINFQMPFESPLQGQVSVVVKRGGVAGLPGNITLTPYAPSVFAYSPGDGTSDPIVVHATSNQFVTSANPAVPGEYLVAYGTGIGDLTTLPVTGDVSPSAPPAAANTSAVATIGGVQALVAFAGMTPASVGLAQFNIQVPQGLPNAVTLPLVIGFGSLTSQPVQLYVNTGSSTAAGLVVQGLTLSSTSIAAGGSVTATVTLKNQGSANAPPTTTLVRLSTSPSTSSPTDPQQSVATPAIPAGQTQAITATIALSAAGTYYTHVYPDISGVISSAAPSYDDAQAITVTGNVTGAVCPNVLTSGAQMTTGRIEHVSVLLADGRVLIAGGYLGDTNTIQSSAEIFDPVSGRFSSVGAMNVARWGHSAVRLNDGRVLIAGGWVNSYTVATDSAELFDPSTGKFTLTGKMSIARADQPSMALLSDGRVAVLGGTFEGFFGQATPAVDIYDPTTGTFSRAGSLIMARRDNAFCQLPNDSILMIGGVLDGSGASTANNATMLSAEIFSVSGLISRQVGNMAYGRARTPAAVALNSSSCLVVGPQAVPAEIYTQQTSAFSIAPDATPIGDSRATVFPNGDVVVSGNGVSVFSSASGSFRALNTAFSRGGHTSTLLGDGRVLLAGGAGSSGSPADTFLTSCSQ